MADYGVDALVHDGLFYDALNDETGDLSFYLKEAQAAAGPVLELCCGTGRLTIPLAASGVAMTGLDFTPSMLDRAKAKAQQAGVDINWVDGDMRDFALDRRFKLIFIPFNSLQNTYSDHDLARIFARVREHLAPGGRFIIDIFNPSIELMVDRSRKPNEFQFQLPDGRRVKVDETCNYDAATQINRVTWIHHLEGRADPIPQRLDMRCFFPHEMDLMLKHYGWRIVQKFGDFREGPFTSDSAKQIFICRSV